MNMEKHRFLAMLFFIISILLVFHCVSGVDLLEFYCPTEFPNYTVNSPFYNNLKLLLESLPSNTSVTGYYNTSIGENKNKVYGQTLCRGDVSATICQNCVENASQDILRRCNKEEAIIWYEFCQVRYSFQMFVSTFVYVGKPPESNKQEKNVSHPIQFSKVLNYLMRNLSDEAAFNPATNMFATGEIKFSGENTIYGLVQCTRDMTKTYCSNCLSSAVADLTACCSYREGGVMLSRICNARFEVSQFFNTSYYRLIYPASKETGRKWKSWSIVLITCTSILILVIIIGLSTVYVRRKQGRERAIKDEDKSETMLLQELANPTGLTVTEEGELVRSEELVFMNLETLKAATDGFSDRNKLGQGGFGAVYMGVLPDGNQVAIKRLSRKSWQGTGEFKNELILIAKLQHRNLVRLLGYGLEGDEKLLVYEFMSNKSLHEVIFDPKRRSQLDGKTYYGIIIGIARGLLYLHEESRLKVIHRDLKPNNVLLDHQMVAKISDFGMARIFGENQNAANTKRIVGTYGYMAPEYAMEGLFSVKSDVFSFGVILLEIISGKRNNGFFLTELAPTLLTYAWQLWNEEKEIEFVDSTLLEACPASEVIRWMHIGLLCVQEDPRDRPSMSDVVIWLGSESMALPKSKQPAFSLGKVLPVAPSSPKNPSTIELITSATLPR